MNLAEEDIYIYVYIYMPSVRNDKDLESIM